ncbi:hypothetical protein, partial [Alkalibacillus haloalkaliphilus]|uniref:hypothetical protein n=1 Tax=Alkalibacillus haloalkaliphilus TaxID=94136 RepID=UPI002935932D
DWRTLSPDRPQCQQHPTGSKGSEQSHYGGNIEQCDAQGALYEGPRTNEEMECQQSVAGTENPWPMPLNANCLSIEHASGE